MGNIGSTSQKVDRPGADMGEGTKEIVPSPGTHSPIPLSAKAEDIHLTKGLKDKLANRVVDLFSHSLWSTLAFAGILLLIDAAFIAFHVITPEQRLMSEKVVMTFITATVVQVGTALAAIIFAVFKSERQD